MPSLWGRCRGSAVTEGVRKTISSVLNYSLSQNLRFRQSWLSRPLCHFVTSPHLMGSHPQRRSLFIRTITLLVIARRCNRRGNLASLCRGRWILRSKRRRERTIHHSALPKMSLASRIVAFYHLYTFGHKFCTKKLEFVEKNYRLCNVYKLRLHFC